jgi:hypothetical protein
MEVQMVKVANRSPERFSVKPEMIAHHFRDVATIRDMGRFQHALEDLFAEYVSAYQAPSTGAREKLRTAADALVSDNAWQPTESDIQQGRALMLDEFSRPSNLGVVEFARLAGKSRAQIYNDIRANRYLTISMGGRRGIRIPDFQLRVEGQNLAESTMKKAQDVDAWTLYGLLTEPNEALDGKSPAQAVNRKNLDQLVCMVLAQLGLEGGAPGLG